MNKNLSKIYTIMVLITLVLLGAWSAWDVYQLRTDNTKAAQLNIEKIKNTIEESYNQGTPFNDNEFFNVIRSLFSDNQELELLTIYSHDTGIEYYYNRGDEVTLLNQNEDNQLTWESLPEYKYNQLMKTRLNRKLIAADRTGLDMDLIYQVVDRPAIYNILIRLLIVVVVLFFTTLLMIFVVSRRKDSLQIIDEVDDEFDQETSSEDDMSLDWDDNGFDIPAETESKEDEIDFSDLELNSDDGDFGDLSLDEADLDDDGGFGDLSLDEADLGDDGGFGDLSLDEADLGDDGDFGDLNLDEADLDNDDGDFGDLNLDEADPGDDGDFGDLNLGGDDDMDTDFSFDDIESDFPEEEDLMAMDHEISPSSEIDDFDFDDIEDSFSVKDTETDKQSLYSPKSGVGWEDFIEERVNLELERAASFDQDLVMGLIESENLNEDNYKVFADELKNDFNYADMIFEYKENGFAIIVPNTDLDAALQTLETFTGKESENYGVINVGISSRNGRIITGSRIFMEAENALKKAHEDEDKNIVGFRSDPDKFRDYLSNKK